MIRCMQWWFAAHGVMVESKPEDLKCSSISLKYFARIHCQDRSVNQPDYIDVGEINFL